MLPLIAGIGIAGCCLVAKSIVEVYSPFSVLVVESWELQEQDGRTGRAHLRFRQLLPGRIWEGNDEAWGGVDSGRAVDMNVLRDG